MSLSYVHSFYFPASSCHCICLALLHSLEFVQPRLVTCFTCFLFCFSFLFCLQLCVCAPARCSKIFQYAYRDVQRFFSEECWRISSKTNIHMINVNTSLQRPNENPLATVLDNDCCENCEKASLFNHAFILLWNFYNLLLSLKLGCEKMFHYWKTHNRDDKDTQ